MPFTDYKNFEDCLKANQDKENPEAYCASVHQKATGKWPREESTKKETDTNVPLNFFGVGDLINKGGKDGQVISSSPEEVLIMWKDGRMTKENPKSLNKAVENPAKEYLIKRKLI